MVTKGAVAPGVSKLLTSLGCFGVADATNLRCSGRLNVGYGIAYEDGMGW